MVSKIKNTVSAMVLSAGLLLAGYGLSTPINAATAATALSVQNTPASAVADNGDSRVISKTEITRRNHGLRRQLGMPFISFSPLLPRRGI